LNGRGGIFKEYKGEILVVCVFVIGYSALVLLTGVLFPIRVVGSESMLPTLARGDLILVKTASVNQLDVGSVIVYQPPKPFPSPIIHRVIEKWVEDDTIYFKTQGDNNNSPDSFRVSASDIVAEYTGIKIPLLGHVVLFIQTPSGMILLVGALLLWIVYALRE